MVETPTAQDAQAHTVMPIVLPEDLLGSSVYAVGTYTRGAGSLPVGSVVIVLTKDGTRFAEIAERPGTTLADTANDYVTVASEPVALGRTDGLLIVPRTNGLACVSENEKWDLPGFCEISRILAFEKNGVTYTVAADDGHASEGELLLLARDILRQVDPENDAPRSVVTAAALEAEFLKGIDADASNLAELRSLEMKDGAWYVTVDPIVWIDCRAITEGEPIPTGCPADPETAPVGESFLIDNTDRTEQTFELAADGGPYFLARMTDETTWATVNPTTLAAALDGTLPPSEWPAEELYDFHPVLTPEAGEYVNRFHVVVEDGKAMLVQKYFP